MDVFKGVFTAQSGTGNQTISGLGFTPKAVLIWSTTQTANGTTDGNMLMWVLTDGTNQRCIWGSSTDNSASSVSRRATNSSRLIDTYNEAGTNLSRAAISSFGSGQFVVNWSVADASGMLFHFIAIGGSGISAYVGTFGSIGTYVADAVPFDAKAFLLFATSFNVADLPITTIFIPSIAWTAKQGEGSYQQGTISCCVSTGLAAADTFRYQRTSRAFAQLNGSGAVALEFAYGGSTGFTPITSNDELAFYLALGGDELAVKAGSGSQPAATGAQAVSGLGFTPKLVGLASYGLTAQTTVQSECRLSVGFGTSANQGHIWIGDVDAADPTVNAKKHSATSLVTMGTPNATGSSSTVEAEAELQSLDADGFTLNWTAADATAREYLWFALGTRTEGLAAKMG